MLAQKAQLISLPCLYYSITFLVESPCELKRDTRNCGIFKPSEIWNCRVTKGHYDALSRPNIF